MDQPPDSLPEHIKKFIERKGSMTEDEIDKQLPLLLTCNKAHGDTRPGCTKLCINTLGHSGQHYCVTHGYFS